MVTDRSTMTVRVVPLRSPDASLPPTRGNASERLLLLRALSEQSWQLTGNPRPDAPRHTMAFAIRPLHRTRG